MLFSNSPQQPVLKYPKDVNFRQS